MQMLDKNEIKGVFGGVLSKACGNVLSSQIERLLNGWITPVEMAHNIPSLPCSQQEWADIFKLFKLALLTDSVCMNDPEACDV